MELLAPAGDLSCLQAALEAGADAVYLGLESLNARRRAKNFQPDEFAQAVALAHSKDARAYLTLNIDLAEREVGEAARILQLAAQCQADAVLVRDPALLALRPAFPELEFHFSTQACISSSADAAAAAQLGAKRVVLSRELSLEEIAAASKIAGVSTEVFVQGALCFSVSGRCWLSSWAGGRSGNRGACTSPCRVPWNVAGEPADTPLSMKDLAAWDRLEDLRQAGVSALKIEGRLKNADWVRRAVAVYRQALSGAKPETLAGEVARLGAVAGRDHTSAYLDARREDLTGIWGRKKSSETSSAKPAEEEDQSVYDFEIQVGGKALACKCSWAGRSQEWTAPKTAVVRQAKAIALSELLRRLESEPVQGLKLRDGHASQPDLLLPPRAINALKDRLSVELRLLRKKPEGKVRVELPSSARQLMAQTQPCPDNRLHLGAPPDRIRIEAAQFAQMSALLPPGGAIIQGLTAESLPMLSGFTRSAIAALPQVFFEADIPALQALLAGCKEMGLAVEVNSLGGWQLARQQGLTMEGGPGLGVLNSLAARQLSQMGLRSVALSMEADRQQLADVCRSCPVPLSLTVFGRPPLMSTRAELSAGLLEKVFADRRGVRMLARKEGSLAVFRPVQPFDWRDLRAADISAAHLVADFVGAQDAAAEWQAGPRPGAFSFNFARSLY